MLAEGHLVLDELDGGEELLLGERHVQLVLEALVEDARPLQHRRPRPRQPHPRTAPRLREGVAAALPPAVELLLARPRVAQLVAQAEIRHQSLIEGIYLCTKHIQGF